MAQDITKDVIGCKEIELQKVNQSLEPTEFFGKVTLADTSTLKTSAAPTQDADIANKKYVDDNAGGGVSFGADNQIPYINVTTDDFDYSAGFTFDGTDLKLKADSSKLYFGAGDDYSIEYNGTEVKHEVGGVAFIHNTGSDNIFIGENSGNYTLTVEDADDNTGIGHDALKSLTTGRANTCIGSGCGDAITSGNNNTFMGVGTGGSLTTANSSTGVGTGVMAGLTIGSNNTGVGSTCLNDVTEGFQNTGVGNNALAKQVLGDRCVAVGYKALYRNTDSDNVAVGDNAGGRSTTAHGNVFIGSSAGKDNTTGDHNILIGYRAGDDVLTDESNILWIDGDYTITPLIYGEFDNRIVRFGEDGTQLQLGTAGDATISYNGTNLVIDPQAVGSGGLVISNMKSGATQGAAGAAADELWKTASHATLPDNVVMIGV